MRTTKFKDRKRRGHDTPFSVTDISITELWTIMGRLSALCLSSLKKPSIPVMASKILIFTMFVFGVLINAHAADVITDGDMELGSTLNWTHTDITASNSTVKGVDQSASGQSLKGSSAAGKKANVGWYNTQSSLGTIDSSDTVTLSLWYGSIWNIDATQGAGTLYVDVQAAGGGWGSPTTIWSQALSPSTSFQSGSISSQDVSAFFTVTQDYDIRFRFEGTTGNDNSATVNIWWDDVIFDVTSTNNPPSLTIDEPAGGNDSVEQGQSFNIQYDLSDTEDAAIVDFYYETDGNGAGGTAIGTCLTQVEGTDQLCAWDTSAIPVAAYYIYGVADDGVNSTVTVVSSGTLDITAPTGANFTIDSCTDCHATPPTTGSIRNNPEGAVVGTHNVLEHDVNNCGNCHVEPGATEYNHRNGNIELLSTIHGQTGSSYSKGTSFPQTNNPTLGTCMATYCHGVTSFTWGSEKTNLDYCTLCHGKETIGADKTATDLNTYLRAPGADGTGVDTAGDTANTDPEVGAHQAHLIAATGISSAIACEECHTVPNAPTVAGHWDTSGPRDAADVTFNGPIGDTDGNDVDLNPIYSSGQCSNTYCHDGRNLKHGWSTAAQIDFETPTWNSAMISTPDGDGNICDNCHGYPPAGAHTASTDCSLCHDHVDATDDGFTGANIATHINHVIDGQFACIVCHNGVPGGATYVTRDVVSTDFTQSSRHVFGGAVTSWDCIVCHREGDETAASSGIISMSSLHNNSGGIVVDMRNVDSVASGWVWDKNNITDAMHSDMDTFCMSCHDSDGASGINVKAADDGVNLNSTRALTPFSSTDDVSEGVGGGTANVAGYERTSVLDVYTQFDPANPSHHAVRGQAYTTHNANWGAGAWVSRALKNGTNLTTVYEAATLHCADCHTTDQNAHGGANGFMLQASSIDNTCYLCHNSSTYSNTSSSDTRWDHSNDGQVWNESRGAKLGQYGANGGSICLNCHGGNPVTDGFGGIHGLPSGTDTRSSQERYRFIGGSYMSHSPSSWTGTSGGTPTCYFDSTTDTQPWSNCTQHGGSGNETEIGRTAAPQYSRGVPGGY